MREAGDVDELIRVVRGKLGGVETRVAATEALGELGDSRAVTPLIEQLQPNVKGIGTVLAQARQDPPPRDLDRALAAATVGAGLALKTVEALRRVGGPEAEWAMAAIARDEALQGGVASTELIEPTTLEEVRLLALIESVRALLAAAGASPASMAQAQSEPAPPPRPAPPPVPESSRIPEWPSAPQSSPIPEPAEPPPPPPQPEPPQPEPPPPPPQPEPPPPPPHPEPGPPPEPEAAPPPQPEAAPEPPPAPEPVPPAEVSPGVAALLRITEGLRNREAPCRRCGTVIHYEEGYRLARERGIREHVVMCSSCNAVFSARLGADGLELLDDCTSLFDS
jgi:hypothetical protein